MVMVVMKKVVIAPRAQSHRRSQDQKAPCQQCCNATTKSWKKSREKEKLLYADSYYGGDLRRPCPRSHRKERRKDLYFQKGESCPCQLMRQYVLNNLRRSQQKIFLASQIGETPSLDALVTFSKKGALKSAN